VAAAGRELTEAGPFRKDLTVDRAQATPTALTSVGGVRHRSPRRGENG
jgi:hypothetical protein